jgi:hypothetical protein
VTGDGRSINGKFHWKPALGLQLVVWNEAVKISGADPDFHRRDRWDAITTGHHPDWELVSTPARAPITDLPPSTALSIVANGPERFGGRRVGMLVTDGADVVAALQRAAEEEGELVETVVAHIGGVTMIDGTTRVADKTIAGGPSVLFDAVVLAVAAPACPRWPPTRPPRSS